MKLERMKKAVDYMRIMIQATILESYVREFARLGSLARNQGCGVRKRKMRFLMRSKKNMLVGKKQGRALMGVDAGLGKLSRLVNWCTGVFFIKIVSVSWNCRGVDCLGKQ